MSYRGEAEMVRCANDAPNECLFRTPRMPDLGKWVTVFPIRPRWEGEDPYQVVVFDHFDPSTRGASPAAIGAKYVGSGETFVLALERAVASWREYRAVMQIVEEPEEKKS